MTNADAVRAAFGRIDTATNNIAADIRRLLDRPDVPQDVKDQAESIATRLEEVAAEVPEDVLPQ